MILNTNSNANAPYTVKIGNDEIKKTAKVKFLGLIIDENLNWQDQIDH